LFEERLQLAGVRWGEEALQWQQDIKAALLGGGWAVRGGPHPGEAK